MLKRILLSLIFISSCSSPFYSSGRLPTSIQDSGPSETERFSYPIKNLEQEKSLGHSYAAGFAFCDIQSGEFILYIDEGKFKVLEQEESCLITEQHKKLMSGTMKSITDCDELRIDSLWIADESRYDLPIFCLNTNKVKFWNGHEFKAASHFNRLQESNPE